MPFAEFALNSTKSVSTSFSPFYVLYGREPTLPTELAVRRVTDCKVESVVQFVSRMAEIVRDVKFTLAKTSSAMSRSANRHRRAV